MNRHAEAIIQCFSGLRPRCIVLVINLLSKPQYKPADFIFDYYTIEDYDANKPFAEQEFAEFKMRAQSEMTDINL